MSKKLPTIYENYVDKPIDVLSKDWHQLALELHGENEQIRNTGVEKLKVRFQTLSKTPKYH